MAGLLQADVVKQLDVVPMESLVAQVIDLLPGGLGQAMASTLAMTFTSISTCVTPAQPCPQIYTSTPPGPPPSSVPVLGISTTSPTPVDAPAMTSLSGVSALPKTKLSKTSDDFPSHCIIPTSVGLSSSVSTKSSLSSTSVVVGPELAIPAEAYPEWINRPGGGKEYLCHLCQFRHSTLDSILTCQETFRDNCWLSHLWQGLPKHNIPAYIW